MNKCLIYEDENGYCKIIVPGGSFKQQWESEENAIARLHQVSIPSVVEFIVCDRERIPKDTTFRDAWRKGTTQEPIKVDFQKALVIHRERIQQACEKKIEKLNAELEISIENDNLPEQVSINRTKKILRQLHELNLTHCKTVEDIKFSVPKELHDVWSFYELRAKAA